ncbi:MAG TPA: hypothetical protein VFA83_19115 [Acidimicrobiales bacterium]|nr:hypothetical protein [Acidimicrobiales bacterium]
MGKRTEARRQSRSAEVWLASYSPLTIDRERWLGVRPFVTECAGRLELDGGPAAHRVVLAIGRLSAWAVGEGLPLDAEAVFDPDTVERFIAVGIPEAPQRSRATYRAVLRRAGPLLTKRAPWEAKPPGVARRQVAVPYTADELDALKGDALVQPTLGRERAARALLALGAGAGLDGRWSTRVAREHVEVVDGAVLVEVGEPAARVVPVLFEWEREVLDLAATACGEFLVGGRSTSRNRAGNLAASIVVAHGHPRLSAARLRSTWLVAHLAMGTRLPELARAAGLQGATVLSDLLGHVPALSEAEAVMMLRGRS